MRFLVVALVGAMTVPAQAADLRLESVSWLEGTWRAKVGKEAQVKVIRNKQAREIDVMIAELPTAITQAAYTPEEETVLEDTALGMKVEQLDREASNLLKIEGGVQVIEVDSTGPAIEAGILKGDVIVMIDNKSVESIDAFEAVTDGLKSGKSVALLVQRRTGPVFLAIRPEDS